MEETAPRHDENPQKAPPADCDFFETVKSDENPPQYPARFIERVKSNWHKICKLMGWKINNKPIDFSLFERSKNHIALVKTIQNKIANKGGTLDKFGMDGQFGTETEKSLKEIPVSRIEGGIPIQPQTPDTRNTSSTAAPSETPMQQLDGFLQSIQNAGEELEKRIIEENLKVDHALNDQELADFQKRLAIFRQKLTDEHPSDNASAYLESYNKNISNISAQIRTIDLNQIHSRKDIQDITASIFTGNEGKNANLTVNPKLATLFMHLFEYEFHVLLFSHINKNKRVSKLVQQDDT